MTTEIKKFGYALTSSSVEILTDSSNSNSISVRDYMGLPLATGLTLFGGLIYTYLLKLIKRR